MGNIKAFFSTKWIKEPSPFPPAKVRQLLQAAVYLFLSLLPAPHKSQH